MKPIKIAVIVGSLRKDSINKKLAHALIELAPKELSFTFASIDSLPLYNQDDDATSKPAVDYFKNILNNADGFLFVTPEYNRSIPGVLKNALDHGSRPYGQNAWAKKPAGVIGASVGSIGTALAQQHLRNILSYLDVRLMGQPEGFLHIKEGFFDINNKPNNQSAPFLQTWITNYTDWIKKHLQV